MKGIDFTALCTIAVTTAISIFMITLFTHIQFLPWQSLISMCDQANIEVSSVLKCRTNICGAILLISLGSLCSVFYMDLKTKQNLQHLQKLDTNGIQNVEGKFVVVKSKNFAILHWMQPMTYSRSKSSAACSKCRKFTNGIEVCGK